MVVNLFSSSVMLQGLKTLSSTEQYVGSAMKPPVMDTQCVFKQAKRKYTLFGSSMVAGAWVSLNEQSPQA